MKCVICGFDLELADTEISAVKVCKVCNAPYEDGKLHMPESYLPILKKFWKSKKSNVCPDAMCLQTSSTSRTTEEHRQIYNAWYAKNKKLFPKVEISVVSEGH